MDYVELSWLKGESSFKEALKKTFGSSGQLVKRYYSSKEQDRKVNPGDLARIPLSLANHLKINPEYRGPAVRILAENKDYIVLHKPHGVHCHPLSYDDKDTLLNFLVVNNKFESLMVNTAHYDRGLLYRLDYETSGVMVLAKNEQWFQEIRGNFASTIKKKFYWAIVDDGFDKEGSWTHYFRAIGQKGARQKVSDSEVYDSQEATLSVFKVTTHLGKALLLVNLKTGLRHQIRAQLSHLGFPILGDDLYGGRKADRLFLHALRYEFYEVVEDPNAELFNIFFDLDRALQVSHDMLGRF
jgi:23S rRNA pseudouridine1911/1915/1917 synthase